MSASSRLSTALHILTLLACRGAEPLTSDYIAASVNTNPVVIRRLMALLKAKGLVASQPGTGGGWELLVAPDSITLLDVRRAVDEGSPFALHAQTPSPKCPVGRGIQGALRGVYARAELAMDNELAQTSVEQLLHAVQGHKPA